MRPWPELAAIGGLSQQHVAAKTPRSSVVPATVSHLFVHPWQCGALGCVGEWLTMNVAIHTLCPHWSCRSRDPFEAPTSTDLNNPSRPAVLLKTS